MARSGRKDHWGVLGLGLFVTLSLTGYMGHVSRQRHHIERLMHEREDQALRLEREIDEHRIAEEQRKTVIVNSRAAVTNQGGASPQRAGSLSHFGDKFAVHYCPTSNRDLRPEGFSFVFNHLDTPKLPHIALLLLAPILLYSTDRHRVGVGPSGD